MGSRVVLLPGDEQIWQDYYIGLLIRRDGELTWAEYGATRTAEYCYLLRSPCTFAKPCWYCRDLK